MPERLDTITTGVPLDAALKGATRAMVGAQKDATRGFRPRPDVDTRQPSKVWHETDNFEGKATPAMVVVLRTRGCEWLHLSGCTMCGYFSDSHMTEVPAADLIAQFEWAMEHEYKQQALIKVYTSGSFFDEREVPAEARRHILERIGGTTGRMSTEDQPHLLTPDLVREATGLVDRFEVGFGMESAHDEVLAHSVNKAFRFKQYVDGATLLRDHGGLVKTYLVLKPPFLTEGEALFDTTTSVAKVAPYSDTVSINPVNVQRHTLVEALFHGGGYRPPWLWTASRVVLDAHANLPEDVTLKCHPVGGGQARGAHNCGRCDERHMKALEDYTLKRSTYRLEQLFEDPACTCYDRWRFELETESLLGGGVWTDPRNG